MLLLVKLQVEAVPTDPLNSTLNSTLLTVTLLHWCFSRFLNCTNRTKSRKASDIRFFSYSDVVNIQVQIWSKVKNAWKPLTIAAKHSIFLGVLPMFLAQYSQ